MKWNKIVLLVSFLLITFTVFNSLFVLHQESNDFVNSETTPSSQPGST